MLAYATRSRHFGQRGFGHLRPGPGAIFHGFCRVPVEDVPPIITGQLRMHLAGLTVLFLSKQSAGLVIPMAVVLLMLRLLGSSR